MTTMELGELAELCERQFGGSAEKWLETFTDSSRRFTPVLLEDASKAVMDMAMDAETPSRVTGRYLVRMILTKCLGTPITQARRAEPIYPDCSLCGKTGFVTVPHAKDWLNGEFWNGEFTYAVACSCEAGELKRTYHRSLESYEREFTNWKEEYPLRQLERRVALGIRGAKEELKRFYQSQEGQADVSQEEVSSSESSRRDDSAEAGGGQEDQEGDRDLVDAAGRTLLSIGIGDEGTAFEGSGEYA
jgi:hypothetical protein